MEAPTIDTQLRPIDEEAIRSRIRRAEKAREGQGYRGGEFLCMEAYTGRWDSRGLEVYLTESHPANDPAGAYVKFAAVLEGSAGPK